MARSLTSELTSGRSDAFIREVTKAAGAVVAAPEVVQAERAEQSAARLLEEAARLLRRAAGVRGQALEGRAAAVDVAMDAALSGRPAEAGAILRREGGA